MKKVFVAVLATLLCSMTMQAQTAEELKAERQQFNSELTSKENKKVEEKLAKLSGGQPGKTGLGSVDGLVNTSTSLLLVVTSTEELLKEYKTEIIEKKDGEIEITKYQANLKDYVATLPTLTAAGVEAAKAVEQLKTVKDDVSKLNPMQAGATIKASNWASDALSVSTNKIAMNTKLLQNLINSCKAAKNL